MDNRSHDETSFDLELLDSELEELKGLDFDLALTGFDERELEDFLADPDMIDLANQVPDVPETPGYDFRRRVALWQAPGALRRTLPARKPWRSCWATASQS